MTDVSSSYEVPCRYFLKAGKKNTRAVMEAISRRAKELGVGKVLIATCTGKTAFEALKIIDADVKFIAVSHVTGFAKPNFQELSEESRKKLEAQGVTVLTAQHAFGGVGRGIRNKLGAYQVDEIMAYTLRLFGQGIKVTVEMALMAADAGLVRTDEDIISVAGTVGGADTAALIQPANSANALDLKIREIICKPAVF